MKYSIIIVAYKAQEHLERCIDSIAYANVPAEDFEIIVIDNSPEPLGMPLPGGEAFTFVYEHHPENPGFAAACNIGYTLAKGEILVFLNPDTQVSGDWLPRMSRHLVEHGGTFHAVGPISNAVAGPQRADRALDSKTPKGAGDTLETKLLIGFCLMLPARLFNAIGGMDPSLVLGCDDLDLSLRLRLAGFRLGIATDCYVHHAFHKSFEANPAAKAMQNASEDHFRWKLAQMYPDGIPSSEELWGCDIFYTGALTPQSLAVVMIVREEEENLRALLPQLAFADELVLVDTNPDRTPVVQNAMPAVIKQWVEDHAPALTGKVRVGMFPWVDDFAAARNYALSLATKDWILWLDADDRVPAESGALIMAALQNPGPLTAQKKCHFALRIKDHGPDGKVAYFAQGRLFPRIPGMAWERRWHENYQDAANRLGLTLVTIMDIEIHHFGYQDPEVNRRKHERNLALAALEPESPHKRLHMGNAYASIGEFAKAREQYLALLAMDWPGGLDPDLVEHVRYMVASTFHKERRFAEMEPYIVPNRKPDAIFLRAELAFFSKDLDRARTLYEDYLGLHVTDYFGTNMDIMHRACEERLDAIRKVGELQGALNG